MREAILGQEFLERQHKGPGLGSQETFVLKTVSKRVSDA